MIARFIVSPIHFTFNLYCLICTYTFFASYTPVQNIAALQMAFLKSNYEDMSPAEIQFNLIKA